LQRDFFKKEEEEEEAGALLIHFRKERELELQMTA